MGTLAEVLSNPLGVVEWFVYLLAAVLFVVGLHMMNFAEDRAQRAT